MSHFSKDIPFGVKASNISSVANFSSTMNESYILIIANDCNVPVNNDSYDNTYNSYDNAALFGANKIINNEYNHEAYIGTKRNSSFHKIAKFNNTEINLDVNTIINGNIMPYESDLYSIGDHTNRWKNLFLSGTLNAYEIKGDGYNISNLNFKDKNTTHLKEGSSNFYYTEQRFDESFENKLLNLTSDDINEGDENKFIKNNVYNGNLSIEGGTLYVDSIFIRNLSEEGGFNITYNISSENTSYVPEGSNLYYTAARAGHIATSSNIHTSNYIINVSNAINANILNVSNSINNAIRRLSTSDIIEGNRLYYDPIMVNNIIRSSNINTSNYVLNNVYKINLNIEALNNYIFNNNNENIVRINNTNNTIEFNDIKTSNYIISTSNITRKRPNYIPY